MDLGVQTGARLAFRWFLGHGFAGVKIRDRHYVSHPPNPAHAETCAFPQATLAPACTPVNSDKTAIFLTLCSDLLWFFEQTLP